MRGLSDLTLASRFRSFSHISSVFAIAVGLLTLVGWLADIQVLKSIAPLLPSMKANSALCLVLVGLALWLLQERSSLGATDRPRKDFISRNASIVCAGSVALVACLTFLEYALGWDFRIDQLLFNDAGGPFEMTPAGRMAPATAMDFLFLSVALILLTRKADRAHRASQFLSLAVGVLSLLALVGYVYGAYQTYGLTYHRSMALHEAGALVIFSAAVLFARPQSGYVLTMTGQGHVGILVRRLLPWAVGVPFLLGWLRLEAERNGIQLTDIEFSLFVVSNMVIFSVLIWASARSLVATEQALLESEERYHSIFDNSDDAILLTVPDGRILAANMAACQMVGRSEEEICQVGRRGLVDSCDPTLPLALEERERTGGFKGELTFVRRNGERFPAEVTSTVFHDSQRNPRTSMIIRDITERKRAEEAVRVALTKYKTLFDSFPLGITVSDKAGKILETNPMAERLLGVPQEEHGERKIDGQEWRIVRPDGTPMPAEEYASVRALKANRLVENVEMGIVKARGEITWISVTAAPLPQEGYGVVVTYGDITERKRAEEALRESEERYRSLVEAAPDVIYTISAEDGSLTSLNPAFEALTGWSRAEWLGKPFVEIVHPDDLPVAVETFQKASRGETPTRYELRVLSKSGEYLVGEFTSTPLMKGGKAVGELGIARDITERKRAEEALRLEKENFRHSLDESPLGVRIVTADGDTLYANRAILDFYGYDSLEELRKTPLRARYTPESYAEFQKRKQQRQRGDFSTSEYEISIVRKNGEVLHLQVHRKQVLWDNAKQFLVMYQDITERKRAEEALRESEERFRRLYQQAPLGYQSLDAEGCFIEVNQAWLDLLRCSRDEVIGRWFGDFLAPQEVDAFKQRFPRFKATGEVHVDLEMVQRAGSTIIVHIDGKTGHDEHGQFKQTHCILYDITERKRAEEELKTAKSRLQRLSHRLLEVQENDRRAIARELHDEIGQILTAAKIDLQVVRRGKIPEDLAARLDENIASLDNCLSRVRNLSLDLRPSMLDDLGLVAALRWQLNRQAERAGFQVHLAAEDAPERLHPELETVCYRIVQEALTNIAKHAHAHNVWVELTSSDREVLLSVRDDGVGFHVESALADAAHGVSFGILGMQERASLLAGKLEIVSAREKGTTVTARFPLR